MLTIELTLIGRGNDSASLYLPRPVERWKDGLPSFTIPPTETGAVTTICKYRDVHIGYGEFT
jgi:hypothetical protein